LKIKGLQIGHLQVLGNAGHRDWGIGDEQKLAEPCSLLVLRKTQATIASFLLTVNKYY
jgi:hypothetical protein